MEKIGTLSYLDRNTCDYDDTLSPLSLPFKVKQISMSNDGAYAFLSTDNQLYVMGLLETFGLHFRDASIWELTKVEIPEPVISCSAGSGCILALGESGTVYVYGSIIEPLYFDPNHDIPLSDHLYIKALPEKIKQISGHCLVYMALGENNHLYAWGFNTDHMISPLRSEDLLDESAYIATPVQINLEGNILDVFSGIYNATVVTDTGIYIWGSNAIGQMFWIEDSSVSRPTKIPF